MSKVPPIPAPVIDPNNTSHRIPPTGPGIKPQKLGGVAVNPGEDWRYLTPEERRQYFINLETKARAAGTNNQGGSLNFSPRRG